MALPIGTMPLGTALDNVIAIASQTKAHAQNAIITLQSQSVDTKFVFSVLDQLNSLSLSLLTLKNVTGLDGFATANLPGYGGSITADMAVTIEAAQQCLSWIITNFPKDSTQTYILAESINPDGSRTLRNFSPSQTAGLQTLLQSLVSTIG